MTAPEAKLAPLTSLRFVAAAAVVVFHLQAAFQYSISANFAPAITFFFVLSGFILTYKYESFSSGREVLTFYAARISRIWPLHAATWLYFIVAFYQPEISQVVLNLLLLQSWSMQVGVAMGMNGVAWSISVELFFYLMLPLVICTRRYIVAWMVAAAAVIAGAIVLSTVAGEIDEPFFSVRWLAFIHTGPPSRFLEFLAGVATAMAYRRWPTAGFSRSAWTALEALTVLAVILCCQQVVTIDWGGLGVPVSVIFWLTYCGSFPVMCLVVLCFAYQGGAISQLLSNRILVFLGEISFSIYMVHQLVQTTWMWHGWKPVWEPAALGLMVAHILIASCLTYFLIERPARAGLMIAPKAFIGRPDGRRRSATAKAP